MNRILVLAPDVANRIAAGEVIERPASIVKELVENSLDAGARSIEIVVESGGRERILVSDDGAGIERDDLPLALLRHATSKIRSADELESIVTLGFRGEALPSIAAVTRLEVITATGNDGAGWRVSAEGGATVAATPAARARGTTVEARALFFNTPARRKFLRSVEREGAVILDTVLSLSLAHPDCAFGLTSEGRRVFSAPAGRSGGERVAQVYGDGTSLRESERAAGGVRALVFVSGPDRTRPDRRDQRFIVNGRPVRDKTLSHALARATMPSFPPGRHPAAAIFVAVPRGEVDVNVHPAKSEVRFRKSGEVHAAVTAAVTAALGGLSSPSPRVEVEGTLPGGWNAPMLAPATARPLPFAGASGALAFAEPRAAGTVPAAAGGFLAQYRDSYIVTADEQGLLLVDQHAAHERVLFEAFLDRIEAGSPEIQPLLTPVAVSLGPSLRAAAASESQRLAEAGILVEPFGDGTLLVRGLPAGLGIADPGGFLRDLLADLTSSRTITEDGDDEEGAGEIRLRTGGGASHHRRRIAASAACRAAVTANMPLSPAKMSWLLGVLEGCRVSGACPHGRPTRLRIAHGAIERAFLRA